MNEKERLEQELEVTLTHCYSSKEENNPDEVDGHFEQYEVMSPKLAEHEEMFNSDYPLLLNLYEDGRFQFWWDATPIPTQLNSKSESLEMLMSLNPAPKPSSALTVQAFNDVVYWLNEHC